MLAPLPAAADGGFITATQDRGLIDRAIAVEQPAFTPPPGVTGITVPHHLLAADLIARGFWAASGSGYDRIILISPDHFDKVAHGFATTRHDLDTVYGSIATDAPAVERLLGGSARSPASTTCRTSTASIRWRRS